MKRIALTLLCAGFAAAAFAADFGLVFDNVSSYAYSGEGTFFQKDRATLWLSMPVSAAFDFYGSLRTDYRYPDASSPFGQSAFSVDVGRLEFKGSLPMGSGSPLALTAGRFLLADDGTRLLSGRMDGATLSYFLPGMSIDGMVGYMGLLPKEDAKVLVSVDDIADYEDADLYFAAPRVVATARVRFTELFARHDLSVTLVGQFDLRSLAEADPDEIVHSQYLALSLKGPIARLLYHEAYADLGTGERTSGFALMGAAGYALKFFMPEVAQLKLAFSADYATGSSGVFAPFVPISQRQVGFAFNAPLGNNLIFGLDASMKPVSVLTFGLKGNAFLRASTQKLEDPDFSDGSKELYLGVEADAYAYLDIASDVSLSLSGGAFVPNAGGTYVSGSPVRYIASGTATLSF
ncbi:MAG: hypothetical protein NT080_02015 [Spirochaetes bacterium]|nr:hypothetical protein [Spirochaetota bacterium]